MMTSFSERELDATSDAVVTAVILDPMINHTAAGLLSHVPHVHATLGVADIQALVIPAPPAAAAAATIYQYSHHC